MRGGTRSPPRVRPVEVLWSWVGAFLGIGLVGYLDQHLFAGRDSILLLGSFGASAVLVYGAPRSPLAQPRNVLGGHFVSAVVGVASYQTLHAWPWLAAATAVATAIALMHLSRTLHPPGGATALIAVIGGPKIHALGYLYALAPAGLGALLLLAVGLLVNNLAGERSYPEFWV
jgi:CBS-domain-containing membrane protein